MCSPNAVASVQTWTLRVARFTLQHFVCTCGRWRSDQANIIDCIAFRQATGGRITVLQPHGVAAVIGFHLGIRLCIRQAAVGHFQLATIGHANCQNWIQNTQACFKVIVRSSRFDLILLFVIVWRSNGVVLVSVFQWSSRKWFETYRCWKTAKSVPGFGRLCVPLARRSRIDWLSWAAVGPVSEKLRCCALDEGNFDCRSAVQVCVPPDTLSLFERGTADTWAVRPPFAAISICCGSIAPLARLI